MDANSQITGFSRVEDTPIGSVEVLVTKAGVAQVNLPGKSASKADAHHFSVVENEISRKALGEIVEYLLGKRKAFDVPIDWSGCTPFQKQVLLASCAIPFGKLMTYGEMASQLGKAAASRAVGGAMARNPIPLIVPCHRLVASDGHLTGYSAADGIKTKAWLLELEGHRIVGEKLA